MLREFDKGRRGIGPLQLGLLEGQDAPRLLGRMDGERAALQRWLPWVAEARPLPRLRAWIDRAREAHAGGEGTVLGIWFHGVLIGLIALHPVEEETGHWSLGYWLAAAYRGRGLCTLAAHLLLHFALRDPDIEQIRIVCAPGNTASQAVARRLGFRRVSPPGPPPRAWTAEDPEPDRQPRVFVLSARQARRRFAR